MNITILCVGKIKEEYLRDAVSEYMKRLSRYGKMEIIEVPDEKAPESLSKAQEEAVKQKEGQRLMEKIPDGSCVVTLEIEGKQLGSVEFAEKLSSLMTSGESRFCFVIGGSLGLSDEVIRRSDWHLSFSKMTFPHQLMRVILLEQLYRANRILSGEPYHK